jgi:hypothetical protein
MFMISYNSHNLYRFCREVTLREAFIQYLRDWDPNGTYSIDTIEDNTGVNWFVRMYVCPSRCKRFVAASSMLHQ